MGLHCGLSSTERSGKKHWTVTKQTVTKRPNKQTQYIRRKKVWQTIDHDYLIMEVQ